MRVNKNIYKEDITTNEVLYKANGSWQYDMLGNLCWDISYEEILSALICEAGKNCTQYASDLLFAWNTVSRMLKKPDYKGGRYLFGFRDLGVDDTDTALTRLSEPMVYGANPYKSMMVLDVAVDDYDIQMSLSDSDFGVETKVIHIA